MPRRWSVVAALAALLVGSCARGNTVDILGASPVDGNPSAVEVQFSGCEGRPDVEVKETGQTVRIALKAAPGGCEPLHYLVVELDRPLGERQVVDAGTGDAVPLVESFNE